MNRTNALTAADCDDVKFRSVARWVLIAVLAAIAFSPERVFAQMTVGEKMKHFDDVFGLTGHVATTYTAVLAESDVPANILWPGEQPKWTIQLQNDTKAAIKTTGKIEVIRYGTRGMPGDVWTPDVVKFDDARCRADRRRSACRGLSELYDHAAIARHLRRVRRGPQTSVPAGRRFVFTAARTFQPTSERIQFPSMSLDAMPGEILPRIGIQAIRQGVFLGQAG